MPVLISDIILKEGFPHLFVYSYSFKLLFITLNSGSKFTFLKAQKIPYSLSMMFSMFIIILFILMKEKIKEKTKFNVLKS